MLLYNKKVLIKSELFVSIICINYLQASSIDTANDFFIDYIKAQ